MIQFKQFIDKKGRWAKRQLGILKRVMESKGFKVEDRLSGDDPYIFVRAGRDLTFEGIRIYKVGDSLAFRVQREADTHPYGRAYPIKVEEMFDDLVGDDMNEERAGRKLMDGLAQEVKRFFTATTQAEDEIRQLASARRFMGNSPPPAESPGWNTTPVVM